MKFSIVLPVSERDVNLVPHTLPSWMSLGADELLACVDMPASAKLLSTLLLSSWGSKTCLRIVEIAKSKKWGFHQARVRRRGFKEAKHDRILTGDIDCARASSLVTKKTTQS